ncbi:MAG: aminoacyl-tRNA hydrolase [Bacilli bacterium]|nr:aminoacyl-tRNA hydrolase [Bacilli bacterium]
MKLVVGLGNPDNKYDNTRHNVGFMLLDYIFDSSNFIVNKKMNSMEYITDINGEKVVVIKPTTYMNLSGDAVIKYVNFYKLNISDIMIIQDDLDMDLGTLKLLFNRGDGGHNGIKDIVLKLGSKNFLRVKIGIGKSNLMDTKDYVLGKFKSDDREILNDVFFKLRDIVNDYISMNMDSLIQKYNTKIHKE